MKKRFFALMLVAFMVVGLLMLPGCEKEIGIIKGDGEPFGKFNPPIKLTHCKYLPAAYIDNLNAIGNGYTETDNMWTREIKDLLGIQLELAFSAADEGSYMQMLTSAIMMDDLPEFINVLYGDFAYSTLSALNDDDAIHDLGAIYLDYASENLFKYVEAAGEKIFAPCTFDGKLKGLPQIIGGEVESFSLYWIREDWLDTLSLDKPETFDDLINVIKEFTDGDPDGDGEKNTIGLGIGGNVDINVANHLFFNAYQSYPKQWVKGEDGKLVYGSITSETKAALTKLNELYKGGYINNPKELSWGGVAVKVINGEIGIMTGKVHTGLGLQDGYLRNKENFKITAVRGMSATDKPFKVSAPLNAAFYFTVSKKCPHPEAAIKMWNLFIEKREDPSVETYNKFIDTADGRNVWFIAPIFAEKPGKNLAQNKNVAEAIKNGTVPERGKDITVYNLVKKFLDGDDNFWGWNVIYGENGSELLPEKYFEDNAYYPSEFNAASTPSMQLYMEQLNQLEVAAFLDIITGEKPIDYFDAFVNDWLNGGGREITEEVNEWYSNYKFFLDVLNESSQAQ